MQTIMPSPLVRLLSCTVIVVYILLHDCAITITLLLLYVYARSSRSASILYCSVERPEMSKSISSLASASHGMWFVRGYV